MFNYYKLFDYFFAIGTNSKKHYLSKGVSSKKISIVRYSVDVDFLNYQKEKWLPKREILRQRYKIKKNDHVFLFCGKIFEPKNPLLISKAFSKLNKKELENIWFLAVGEGLLRRKFQNSCKNILGKKAIFVGFKNQKEIGKYYAISDTLILPSTSGETWGLVVNEALQYGLKAIVSDITGSSVDLIKSNEYGYIFSDNNSNDLKDSILMALKEKTFINNNFDLPHPKELAFEILKIIGVKS